MGIEPAHGDRRQLSKPANEALDANLRPGEEVRVIVRGVYESAMIALDRRLLIFKPGLMSSGPLGHKVHSWPYGAIRDIHLTSSLLFGIVCLEIAPASEALSIWTADRESVRKSSTALDLGRRNFKEARERVPLIRQLISEGRVRADTAEAAEERAEEVDTNLDEGEQTAESNPLPT